MKKDRFSDLVRSFNLKTLFNELGWNNFNNQLPIAIQGETFELKGIAEKKGFVVMLSVSSSVPSNSIRKQVEGKLAKIYFEHLIIYTDLNCTRQIWQLPVKEENKPKQVREIIWYSHQDTEVLFQRLRNLFFTLDEEEKITIIDVRQRVAANLARNTEQVTKKFYDQFKKQHTAFLDFIKGIDDHLPNKDNTNKQWYASLMLNRLMFCYFIQKKGFLNQDINYLQNKLTQCQALTGKDNFYSFYRSFLLKLFHDGLGKPANRRRERPPVELGRIPYLNGGLFDVHELERQFDQIQIEDDSFNRIFNFFDQWNWHLDSSKEADGRDINPDVIGYIFEKYINDRAAMGAYYTKEDITDYIGKNTIIPFLIDETERHYKEGFKPGGEVWQFLRQSGDTYIYDAVKYGIPENGGIFDDLPSEIKAGFIPDLENQPVSESTKPHLWEIRRFWNQRAPQHIGLPTEIYRELIERRKRYAELKAKIAGGEITHINDFISWNLNIRQFIQDFLEQTQDPEFIKNFFKTIQKLTILDPTCGSGAFLFAALNILEPLYETCIERIEGFVAEANDPANYKDLPERQQKTWESISHKDSWFKKALDEINSGQHLNQKYFVYKSIILNNLYGVDIMKEAVEIAKLRLFLKLVATVDANPRKDNFGLEPLPDIDFNIRAGNTLVGFASEQELLDTIRKKDGLFSDEKLASFKEEFIDLSAIYHRFQNAQLISDQGSDEFRQAKAELQRRLKLLNDNLNRYLATNYGIDGNRQPNEYKRWLVSHQPFHWFAEFYEILAVNGGFDVIIGNPPYVEYSEVRNTYKIQNFNTESTGNLFSFMFELSYRILKATGHLSFIVPISSTSTPRMTDLQKFIFKKFSQVFVSSYAVRPGKLFDGADMNLNIWVLNNARKEHTLRSTSYLRWYTEFRNELFSNLRYENSMYFELSSSILKIQNKIECDLLLRLNQFKTVQEVTARSQLLHDPIYYHSGGRYFRKCLTEKLSNEYKLLKVPPGSQMSIISVLSSSLYFWYWVLVSDTYHVTKPDIQHFFIPPHLILNSTLGDLGTSLLNDIYSNAVVINRNRKDGTIKPETNFFVGKSKPIIDQIDTVLAQYYGFTEEELDFIINYDIKYRMGKALLGEEENEEEEDN